MDKLITLPKFQFILDTGAPASGYKLFVFETGGTTKKTIYTTRACTVESDNPITLNTYGMVTGNDVGIFCTGTFKLGLYLPTETDPPTGAAVWTMDNLRVSYAASLTDADADTGIEVERTADVDKVYIKTGGTDRVLIDSDGLTLQSGASVNEFSTDGLMAGNSDDAVPTEQAVVEYTAIQKLLFQRAKFTYNGGATAYTVKVGAAAYWCKDKYSFWNSELTTGAIGTPAANTKYYLYLDYSAITSGTEITATELIWSSTAPTWNATYKQWMNTDDRCIFGVKANAAPTNILEFFHDGGDLVTWADDITVYSGTPSSNWTNADFTAHVPLFCSCADAVITASYVDTADKTASWRTDGQTGTTGHIIGAVNAAAVYTSDSTKVILSTSDANRIIEVHFDAAAGNNTINVYMIGWYFPAGI